MNPNELDDIADERGRIMEENAMIEAEERAGERKLWYGVEPWAVAGLILSIIAVILACKM